MNERSCRVLIPASRIREAGGLEAMVRIAHACIKRDALQDRSLADGNDNASGTRSRTVLSCIPFFYKYTVDL